MNDVNDGGVFSIGKMISEIAISSLRLISKAYLPT